MPQISTGICVSSSGSGLACLEGRRNEVSKDESAANKEYLSFCFEMFYYAARIKNSGTNWWQKSNSLEEIIFQHLPDDCWFPLNLLGLLFQILATSRPGGIFGQKASVEIKFNTAMGKTSKLLSKLGFWQNLLFGKQLIIKGKPFWDWGKLKGNNIYWVGLPKKFSNLSPEFQN